MILNIFAVYDAKSKQFGTPMFLVTSGQAIRSFADEANRADPQNIVNTHPEDFTLHHLGEYDTENGVIATAQPKEIASATALKIQ